MQNLFDPEFNQSTPASSDVVYSSFKALPDITNLDDGQLIALLDLIVERLPPTKMAHLNLENELVLQLYRAKALLARTLDDPTILANQKAQVMNSVSSVIADLVRLQERLYNTERFKAMEAILVEAIKDLPLDVAEAFIDKYEQMGSSLD